MVDKVIDLIGLINLPLISTEVLVMVEAPEQSGESVDNQRADGVWQLLAEVIQAPG